MTIKAGEAIVKEAVGIYPSLELLAQTFGLEFKQVGKKLDKYGDGGMTYIYRIRGWLVWEYDKGGGVKNDVQ